MRDTGGDRRGVARVSYPGLRKLPHQPSALVSPLARDPPDITLWKGRGGDSNKHLALVTAAPPPPPPAIRNMPMISLKREHKVNKELFECLQFQNRMSDASNKQEKKAGFHRLGNSPTEVVSSTPIC